MQFDPNLSAQGLGANNAAVSRFGDHVVVVVGNTIYDPSYGLVATSKANWEDQHFTGTGSGFGTYYNNHQVFLVSDNLLLTAETDWTAI